VRADCSTVPPFGDVCHLLRGVTEALDKRLVGDGDDVVAVEAGRRHRIERLQSA
jgi:hypothetical protein